MREVSYKDYLFYVTTDGDVYNKNHKKLKKLPNHNRQNREHINTVKGQIPVAHLIAKAFPEICGEWFEGCEVHHIDKTPSNNSAYNLQILSHEEHKFLHNGYIVQKNINGDVINKYLTSYDASKNTGISDASIRMCLCGKSKTSGGFIWVREN